MQILAEFRAASHSYYFCHIFTYSILCMLVCDSECYHNNLMLVWASWNSNTVPVTWFWSWICFFDQYWVTGPQYYTIGIYCNIFVLVAQKWHISPFIFWFKDIWWSKWLCNGAFSPQILSFSLSFHSNRLLPRSQKLLNLNHFKGAIEWKTVFTLA